MSFYVLGQITNWVLNVVCIIALVVIIQLAIKTIKALDVYINDKRNSK